MKLKSVIVNNKIHLNKTNYNFKKEDNHQMEYIG